MPSLFDDLDDDPLSVPSTLGGRRTNLTSSLAIALRSDPEKELEVRRRANLLGVDPSLVRKVPQAALDADAKDITNKVRQKRPITEEFLADPDNAAIAHDDVDSLVKIEEEAGFFGRLHDFLHENVTEPIVEFGEEKIYEPGTKGFKHGRLTHELGHAGHDLRQAEGENRERIHERVNDIKGEMEDLGMSNDGWLGFITSAAEIIGQQAGTFDQAEAAQRVLIGANAGVMFGAAVGAAVGPVGAGIGAGLGAVKGAISGAVAHFATDAFIVESGHSYIDLIEQGVPEQEAEALAIGVGVINAGLEVLGASAVTRPIRGLLKNHLRKAAGEIAKRPSVARSAARFAGNYGSAVGIETATEIVQEGVSIAAEEIGKEFQEGPTDDFSFEDTVDRLEDIAVKTFKGMAVLGLPGASVGFVSDRTRAKRATQAAASFARLHGIVTDSKLARRSPKAAVEHVQKSLGVETVQMPVARFNDLVSDMGGVPEDLLPNERVMQIYNEASAISGDVTIPVGNFTRALLMPENKALFERYSGHVRWAPGEMTGAEAREFQTSGVVKALEGTIPAAIEDQEAIENIVIDDKITSLAQDVRDAIDGSEGIPKGMPRSVARVIEEQAQAFVENAKSGTLGTRAAPPPAGGVPTTEQITEAVQSIEGTVTPEKIAEALGPLTRPQVTGPAGKPDSAGPESRPVVVGPKGQVETGGPDSRPVVVGPAGKPDSAGPEARPIVVGPSGFVETGGPDSRPLVVGPQGKIEEMGPDTRPVVVGPSGKVEHWWPCLADHSL